MTRKTSKVEFISSRTDSGHVHRSPLPRISKKADVFFIEVVIAVCLCSGMWAESIQAQSKDEIAGARLRFSSMTWTQRYSDALSSSLGRTLVKHQQRRAPRLLPMPFLVRDQSSLGQNGFYDASPAKSPNDDFASYILKLLFTRLEKHRH